MLSKRSPLVSLLAPVITFDSLSVAVASAAQFTMLMTPAQREHWETFGYLVLPQLYTTTEVAAIAAAFDDVLQQAAVAEQVDPSTLVQAGAPMGPGGALIIDPGLCERHDDLMGLPDQPRLAGPVEALLGAGCFYEGSDGRIAIGDTAWHADGGWRPELPLGRDDPGWEEHTAGSYWPGAKAIVYLEPLNPDTGCLRLIPGSQRSPLHESLRSLQAHVGAPRELREVLDQEDLGLAGVDVPCQPVPTQPGDVVLFSHQCFHASFSEHRHAGHRRRFFAMGFKAKASTQVTAGIGGFQSPFNSWDVLSFPQNIDGNDPMGLCAGAAQAGCALPEAGGEDADRAPAELALRRGEPDHEPADNGETLMWLNEIM